ncbi:MAG TPA: alpha/beta hydrolase [Candidatus Elarobacter sp.]
MSRALRFLAVAAGCAALAAPCPTRAAAPAVDGTYAVVIQWPPHSPWQRLGFRLAGDGGSLLLDGREVKLSVTRVGDSMDVRWASSAGDAGFHGVVTDDRGVTTFAGTFTRGKNSVPFQAIRLADRPPNGHAQRDGAYRVSADRFIFVARSNEADDAPVFLDTGTHRTGVLMPVWDTEEVSGPTLQALLPIAARFSFAPATSAAVGSLSVRYGNDPPLYATKTDPYRTEDVTFHNGAVTLRGTLFVPASAGTHPAVVLIHEAGPKHRPAGWYPFGLMHLGFAVLAFDKRGAGESTGNYRTASFPDLAGDVVAGIDAIKRNSAVDPKRIGIFAGSNGGWVAPVVATQSRDVAFVICRVCSMLTVAQNQAYERETFARDAGSTDAGVARAVALHDAYTNAVMTDSGWEALRAQVAAAKNADWFDSAGVPNANEAFPPDPASRAAHAAQLAFDPAPFWRRVTVPALFLYADNDRYVKTSSNAPRATVLMNEAGNHDAQVIVLEHADHAFIDSETGLPSEQQRENRFAAGFIEVLTTWSQAHHLAPTH